MLYGLYCVKRPNDYYRLSWILDMWNISRIKMDTLKFKKDYFQEKFKFPFIFYLYYQKVSIYILQQRFWNLRKSTTFVKIVVLFNNVNHLEKCYIKKLNIKNSSHHMKFWRDFKKYGKINVIEYNFSYLHERTHRIFVTSNILKGVILLLQIT